MAGYIIHLAVAKRYIDIKYQNELDDTNRAKLLFGSLAPDLLKTDNFGRSATHFSEKETYFDKLPNYHKFMRKYDLNDSFLIGYLIHLITDYYFYGNYLEDRLELVYDKKVASNKYDNIFKIKGTNKFITWQELEQETGIYRDYDILDIPIQNHYAFNYWDIRQDISSIKSCIEDIVINYDKLTDIPISELKFRLDTAKYKLQFNDKPLILNYDSIIEFIESTTQKCIEILKKD